VLFIQKERERFCVHPDIIGIEDVDHNVILGSNNAAGDGNFGIVTD